ncbi:hypothetical protein BB561_004358 [Smittium simulii]|uniref:RRM domain-containing protein n=1 Tax=Smittium simulii TaxID=133385 RepID=A0A2T9YGS9_9FUNG|nr:hypothetical protein BB561_004358 [Smittium simulii]
MKPLNRSTMVNGYIAVPLSFSAGSKQHYIYVKKHSEESKTSVDQEPIAFKKLFVLNLPVDATEAKIKALFKQLGGCFVHRVVFSAKLGSNIFMREAEQAVPDVQDTLAEQKSTKQLNKTAKAKLKQQREQKLLEAQLQPVQFGHLLESGNNAHIEFIDESHASKALSLLEALKNNTSDIKLGGKKKKNITSKSLLWPSPQNDAPSEYVGLQRYLFEYRGLRPPSELLRQELSSYMEKFEAFGYQLERQRVAASENRGVPDEDGFITVSHSKHKKDSTTFAPSANSSYFSSKIEEKDKSASKLNFYRYQIRETKKSDAVQLKHKFEQDKAKIIKMRSNRKFNPY